MGGNRAAVVLVLVITLAAAACGGSDEPRHGAGERAGGHVTIALDTEPDVLNVARSQLAATAIIGSAVFATPYRVTPDLDLEPWLIDGEAELTEDPFTVTYRIREDAVWSDGTPITARDFEFTWQTMTNPDWDIAIRDPADRVERAEVIDERTIRFVYSEPYAGWQTLFGREGVLPAHVLEGEDFNTVWDDEITVASGPFQFKEWRRGTTLTLERNPAYWDDQALLDEIAVRFIPDTNTVPQALRGGEVDLAAVEPAHIPALRDAGLQVSAVPGVRWEFLDMRMEVLPAFVRQAIAHGVDRDGIVDALARPALPDAVTLDSLVYLTGDEAYEPHFSRYPYDPDRTVTLLEDHGCQREPDGVFACDGERLDYTYATIAGRDRSGQHFEMIQAQLRDVGIRVNASFGDIPTVLQRLERGEADLSQLSIHLGWLPFFRGVLFACEAPFGTSDYCNEEVTELLERGSRTIDADEQRRTYNRAGELLAEDVPVLPLYQVPDVLVWHERFQGVQHGLHGILLAGAEHWHLDG